jgi:hypothetical protein
MAHRPRMGMDQMVHSNVEYCAYFKQDDWNKKEHTKDRSYIT